jgi:hypothetical protein
VYDVGAFSGRHPGGPAILRAYAGLDATDAFRRAHRSPVPAGPLRRRYVVARLQPPPADGRGRRWAEIAQRIVQLQNILRLDRSFLAGTVLVDPTGRPATELERDRGRDLCVRFRRYLGEDEQALVPDSDPVLRAELDDLERRLAGRKERALDAMSEAPVNLAG